MATSETVTPEARGKAAARDRWLAQMGGLRKNGTFRNGKMRGKTYDQANQEFEGMWTNAPEALKESYAQHARSGATKSEVAEASGVAPTPKVTNASLNATKPGETTAQAQERFRQSRTGVKPAPKPAGGNSFADLTKAPAIPAGGVNSVGNGEFEGGRALGPSLAGAAPPGVRPSLAPKPPAAITPEDAAAQNSVLDAIGNKSVVAPTVPSSFASQTETQPSQPVGQPVAPPVANPAPQQRKPATSIPRIGPTPAGQELVGMKGGVAQYAPVAEVYGAAKPSISNTIASTSVTADPTKPVMIQGQTVEQQRADYQAREAPRAAAMMAPIARQTSVAPVLPPRGPASQPVRTGSAIDNPNSAFSDAAYARTAAAQQTGVETTAIRAGTASDETRAKHPELVSKIAADTAAMAGLSLVRPGTTVNAPRSTIVPGVQPARQPLFRR